MTNYNITNEELNEILLSSPMTLPDSPSAAGMKAQQIKKHFYKFIISFAKKINEKLSFLSADADSSLNNGILAHNESPSAHEDIREITDELSRELVSLCELYASLGDSIENKVGAHNTSSLAHGDIRAAISASDSKAQNALVIAQGRARAMVFENIFALTSALEDGLDSLCVGDSIYIRDKNVPDFWVSNKYDSKKSTSIPVSLTDGCLISAGYYDLIGYESGIDTSAFASADEMAELSAQVSAKENAMERIESAAQSITLNSGTEYNCGLRSSLVLTLPETVSDKYEAIVNFESGTSPTTIDKPDLLILKGDDCRGGDLYPVKNRIYEINIKNICSVLVGIVGSVDYEVAE